MHSIGGLFWGEEQALRTYTPAVAFDAVIYLDRVTASHPLATAKLSE
jgi:hypothetical protein